MRSKTVQLTALLLALALLASCGAPASPSERGDSGGQEPSEAEVPAEPDEPSAPEAPVPEPLSMLYRWRQEVTGCGTDAGFYRLTDSAPRLTDGRSGRRLLFTDYTTRREVFLCADPACGHDSPDCTAVFPTEGRSSLLLFTMGGRVFLLSKSPDMDGSTVLGLGGAPSAEVEPAVLTVLKGDGTGRETLFTFPEGLTVEDFAAGDGTSLWFITKRVATEESAQGAFFTSTDRRLVRLDPEARELTAVCGLDLGDGITWKPAGCFGRELILTGIDFGGAAPDPGDPDRYDSAVNVFAALDADTGALREIWRSASARAGTWALSGDTLWYAPEGGDLLAVSLTGGGSRTAWSDPPGSFYGVFGGQPYTWDGEAFHFLDPATGEVTRSPLKNRTLGTHIGLIAEAGDRALVIYDSAADFRPDGSFSVTGQDYALMTLADLFTGVADYQPIETAEAGL